MRGTRGRQQGRQKSQRGQGPAERGRLSCIPSIGGTVGGDCYRHGTHVCVCMCANVQSRGLGSLDWVLAMHTHVRDGWGPTGLSRRVPPVGSRQGKGTEYRPWVWWPGQWGSGGTCGVSQERWTLHGGHETIYSSL